ncbi:MAG: DNA polymerase III subunit epsilon [Gammaproteobacteria bacterium RIFCSPHIGHO2_12_FULL_40_19]|nr:MAG: DNA polymerase III subunit epsilon [Gammaproteobacteria bacterium RIFCSPHIGHO2_12_FULL_40_19]
MRQIVLDTETTGLSPDHGHRLIEVGCLEIINRRITNNHFHAYVNPKCAIDEGAVKVHGITATFLKDKPVFADIAEQLFAFIDGAELIIHNAPFDLGFLNMEFKKINPSRTPITQFCAVIDTLVMARREHPGQQNTLDALCRRYGVNNKHRELHGALLDAELLAQVYLLMTGGQTQLFAAEEPLHPIREMQRDREVVKQQRVRSLPVITASEAEIAAHNTFLAMLAKKGKCVWQETQ